MGLSIFPCGKERGKKPLVSWKKLQLKLPSQQTLEKWKTQYPSANLGLVTGRVSGITVVDCDNPATGLDALFTRYGETTAVAQSQNGGYHLYYRYSTGQRTAHFESEKIDLLADGAYVVAPPSVNSQNGLGYSFILGGLEDFDNLPCMRDPYPEGKKDILSRQAEAYGGGVFVQGSRNNNLFLMLKQEAGNCPSREALLDLANKLNLECCSPPLSAGELRGMVKSVWGYKEDGRLYRRGDPQVLQVRADIMQRIMYQNPMAASLYIDLKIAHGMQKGKEFAVSPPSYSKRVGWSQNSIRTSIKVLIAEGVLRRCHVGGSKKGDPHRYTFV